MNSIKVQWAVKHTLVLFSALLCLLAVGRVAAAQDPINMLEGVTQRVMQELRTHRAELERSPAKLYSLVDHLILPYVDFVEMARWVVGRNAWKAADAATQNAFIQEFRALVVRSYARSLLEYTDQKIEFLPLRGSLGSQERIQVLSLIKESGKSPVRMDYHLIREGDAWKVYDIIIEGVSLMQGYRAQFAEDVRQGGVAAAIDKMRRHHGTKG